MVAVKNYEADRYIVGVGKEIAVFLVFGADPGLISERASALISKSVDDKHDPFQLITLQGDDIADDPSSLIDEANTISMFQSRRAIHIVAGRKAFVEPVKTLLEDPPKDCTIVISAGVLKGDAPLRAACSRSKIAAAIECYPDNEKDVARLIDEELRSAKLRIGQSAKSTLVASLGADRLTTRSELQKLILYAHGQQEITEKDVLAVIADASGEAFDDAVDAAFLGKRSEASEIVWQVLSTGENINVLVSACIRRCLLLHRMILEIENGSSANQVMERFGQARLPFTKKNNIQAQLGMHTSKRLVELIGKLEAISFEIRESATMSDLIGMRMLWAISASRSRTVRN